jgi:hypothetical protein
VEDIVVVDLIILDGVNIEQKPKLGKQSSTADSSKLGQMGLCPNPTNLL